MKLLRVMLGLLIVCGALAIGAAPAQACSCAMGGVQQRMERADAVFTGEIVERTGSRYEPQGNATSAGSFRYTIDVDRVYKGEVAEVQTVVAGADGASCGVVFPKRGPILVFGNTGKGVATGPVEDGELWTGLCDGSRTKVTVPASFGAGAEPPTASGYLSTAAQTDPAVDTDQPVVSPLILGLAAVVLVLVGVLIYTWRRSAAGVRQAGDA